MGLAYYLKERYPDAVAVLERNVARRPEQVWDYLLLAAAYAQMDHAKEAARAADMVRRLDPFFKGGKGLFEFRDPADAARVAEGLREAGLN